MPEAKERAAEILRSSEGDRTYLLLLDYADMLARIHGWRKGKMLPGGASPETVANEVIVKVLDGTRTWDEGKEPSFLNALKGMVRSEIGHLYERAEERIVEPIDLTRRDGEPQTDGASDGKSRENLVLQRSYAFQGGGHRGKSK